MTPLPLVSDAVFAAFLKCPHKAYLKLHGAAGEPSEYERLQERLAGQYRAAAQGALLQRQAGATVTESPPSLPDAIRGGVALILDATLRDGGESCHLDALEKVPSSAPAAAGSYRPVLFRRHPRVTPDDRLLLAFGASILARIQKTPPDTGRIVHGGEFKASRVRLASLARGVRQAVSEIRALGGATKPPPVLLNKHCPECEFRTQCRQTAAEKDDLSLLSGLSAKEIDRLHHRGIFTVTQYSHTFRPGRLKRAAEAAVRKHDQSLQALAVRERTVYVAQRPTIPVSRAQLYLDVEGLPDQDCYYLIGLTHVEGACNRHWSFWADRRADEAAIWSAFLRVLSELGDDFTLFHYGRYESHFLERMEARHGGDAALIARVRSRSVNALSLLYGRVYFPAFGNDLKSVAGCLGFRWSAPDASGLRAVAWRYGWEETKDERLKQQLLAYNREDCSALERVVGVLLSLGRADRQPGEGSGPRIADVEAIEEPSHRRFGRQEFALPGFARIIRCAYFDYQRTKVLCRVSPAKRAARGKAVRRRRRWRVNREVQCGAPAACERCGSGGLDRQAKYRKLVIDLKPFRGGLKTWVTAYNVWWYRCRQCRHTQAPEDYRALASQKYGWGLASWVVYAWIALRLTNDAAVEALHEQFQLDLSDTSVSNLRRRAADYYRPTYESLLATLRGGPLVHADETRVQVRGRDEGGYVWAFASPETAVYAYSPTQGYRTIFAGIPCNT